ncbi:MAG TPA: choice-of-anchor D domain-containing protein [Kofleriaceae bacterium]|nr:choice-of-anchor D domain-containing protein [Kofleriaceae bacterium]
MSKRWLVLLLLSVWLGTSGVAFAVTVDPEPIDVGQVVVDTSGTATGLLGDSQPRDVTLSLAADPACDPFQISPLSLTIGPTPAPVTVTFHPTTTGAQSCTVTVTGGTGARTFTLTGSGVAPPLGTLDIPPAEAQLDFGSVVLDGSQTRTVTLTNHGNVAVTGITGVFDPPAAGYSIDPPLPVPFELAGNGGTASVTVKFAPVAGSDGGPATLTFSGAFGASGSATSVVNLAAQVLAVTVTPAIDFGSFRFDTAPARPIEIANGGGATVSIASVTFVGEMGTQNDEVAIQQILLGTTVVNSLPVSVPGGTGAQPLVVTVKAVPHGRTGLVKGHFVVHSTTQGVSDQNVAVTGTATATTVSSTPLSEFGAVDIDVAASAPPTRTAAITNSGTEILDITAIDAVPAGSPFALTAPLPALPIHLAPGASQTITVRYQPTVEHTASQPDTLTLHARLAGVVGVSDAMLAFSGRGIDRTLVALATPAFPPTFRNPGDAAPVRALTIQNTGEASLRITAAMLDGEPVWHLLDAAPVDIPGGSSHDFMIRFAPTDGGPAPPGTLTLTSDDNLNRTRIISLAGSGVLRNVAFGPSTPEADLATVDLGFTGVDVPLTAADLLPIINNDPATAFTIRAIELSGDPGFRIDDAPAGVALPPATTRPVAITFTPTAVGEFQTTARLFLDQDPTHQAQVRIVGHAVFVEAHGGGGCSAGVGGSRGGDGLGLGLAAALVCGALGRRRRPARKAVAS